MTSARDLNKNTPIGVIEKGVLKPNGVQHSFFRENPDAIKAVGDSLDKNWMPLPDGSEVIVTRVTSWSDGGAIIVSYYAGVSVGADAVFLKIRLSNSREELSREYSPD